MKKFLAGLLMTVGALIGGLSGLCTLVVVVMGMGDNGDGELIAMALFIGAIPIALGAGVFFVGWVLWRQKPRPVPPADNF